MRYWWLVLFVAGSASAAELRSLEVGHDRGEYMLESEVWFDAGLEEVFLTFSTWSLATQFSNAIVEARDLEPDAQGRPGFYTRNRGCILFFCKSIVRQGWIEKEDNRIMRAFVDPDYSDLVFSNEVWTFHEDNGGTRVVYTLHFDPKFWVPPAIGPYMIKRKMRKEADGAIERIEAVARNLVVEGGRIVD